MTQPSVSESVELSSQMSLVNDSLTLIEHTSQQLLGQISRHPQSAGDMSTPTCVSHSGEQSYQSMLVATLLMS